MFSPPGKSQKLYVVLLSIVRLLQLVSWPGYPGAFSYPVLEGPGKAPDDVGATELGGAAVAGAELEAGAVAGAELEAGAIVGAELEAGAVGEDVTDTGDPAD